MDVVIEANKTPMRNTITPVIHISEFGFVNHNVNDNITELNGLQVFADHHYYNLLLILPAISCNTSYPMMEVAIKSHHVIRSHIMWTLWWL